MGSSSKVTTPAIVIDSKAKQELEKEYWSVLKHGILIFLVPMFVACLFGYPVIIHKRREVLSLFAAAFLVALLHLILVIVKGVFVFLFYIGREDIVIAWNQYFVVMIIFDTVDANAVLDRIQLKNSSI